MIQLTKKYDWLPDKPSGIIQAMVDGLREYSQDERFEIDMGTFGYVSTNNASLFSKRKAVCFGCAATCTIMKITNVKLWDFKSFSDFKKEAKNKTGNSSDNDYYVWDVSALEVFIDLIRRGHDLAISGMLNMICYFYTFNEDPSFIISKELEGNFDYLLTTSNWESELPKVEKLIARMKDLGI